ncbi:protein NONRESPONDING TO OXYLIPINS 2, mitochondrial-like [Macadamia integrifolia]|uniref:protein NONRESPONDING TO OXYLIPINS 2, mitochondrial-like n=1 Tax=Macadamia integrifolia TaxID=60698 RepID=UPI001C4F0840|nr:protein NONRESPONDING TO OXYLIPINS 2, mitochondrial-like [Macadamia integrifolia]
MASSCSRFIRRTALSPLKSAVKSKIRSPSFDGSATASSTRVPLSSRSNCTAPSCRFSLLNRSPSELGCAQSLLPLHSAVAVSRLTSCLSSNSRSCRSLSQELGLSVPR